MYPPFHVVLGTLSEILKTLRLQFQFPLPPFCPRHSSSLCAQIPVFPAVICHP